nr:putative ribonuclease H-like domain-containing protein [Tanacetum cinerariifolium]
MLADAKLPVTFWAKAVNTACYVQNRVLVNKSQNKTPYELFSVDAGTNSTNLLCTKDAANQEVKKYESSIRYIVLPNWAHDDLLESTLSKSYEESSTQVPEGSRNPNPAAFAFNPSADQMETLIVESLIPTNLRRSMMLCKTQVGWKLCKKSSFNSKSRKSRLWLIVLKGSDPLGQNGFSRTRRIKGALLSEIRPG